MAKTRKNFKKHMMYSKSGESKMAKTYEEHMLLKKKGWGHTKPKRKLKGLQAAKYFIGGLISGIKGAKQSKQDIAKAEADRQAQLAKEEELRNSRQKLTMSPEIEKMKEGLGGTEIQRRQEAAERARAGAMAAATRGGSRVDPFAAARAGEAQESKLATEQATAQRAGLKAGVEERGKLRTMQEDRQKADYARQAQLADYAREDVMAAQSNLASYQQQQYGAIDAGIGTVTSMFAKSGARVKLKDKMRKKYREGGKPNNNKMPNLPPEGLEQAIPVGPNPSKDQMDAGEAEVTPGKFSHEKNPIDLVQKNGEEGKPEKIGEMTGGEAIVPPKNVKQIRNMIKTNDGQGLVRLMNRLLTKWDKEAGEDPESEAEFGKTMKAKHGHVIKPRVPSGKQKFKWRNLGRGTIGKL